ncbi:MAG: lysine--tRNA ligase [bacterium]|nr:lysine--tRNA ligase [bacterium]
MGREDETRDIRIQKLKNLEAEGVLAYPGSTKRTHTIKEVQDEFEELERSKSIVTLTGRIRSIRRHGGSCFVDLQDGTASFQLFVSKKELDETKYKLFVDTIDPGDFIEASGVLFVTKQNQQSLQTGEINLLSKALRDLPSDHFGIKNIETRLRKRYIDLAVNEETRELFRKKAVFWQTIRNIMLEAGFLEVWTPVLENIPGGAEAEPFITHYKALDREFYLRISLELPLKKLLVGGYEKVFEIGRIFRNEGISAEHLQDYTQLEFYWAYADYHDLMKFLVTLYRQTIIAVTGGTEVSSGGQTVDWGNKWKEYDYVELFQERTGLDLRQATEKDLQKKASELKLKFESFTGRGRLIDLLYKKTVRPTLIEPGFLLNPPVEIEPLAKRLPQDNSRVQRLQVVAWGTELGKGFTELNDPLDQRARFEEQMRLREAGDTEAQMIDEDYLEAQEYGMPPCTGFGLSERLFAVLMDKPARETVMFPPLREEGGK